MELSDRCREYWGITAGREAFGVTLEHDGLFRWAGFDRAVTQLRRAISRRQFIILTGAACSAKTTAWTEAQRQVAEGSATVRVCQPRGLDPRRYDEQTIFRAILNDAAPTGTRLAHAREDRATQVRRLLEDFNRSNVCVVLAVNDAHAARLDFLLMCKRLWDDLDGFDRLLSVVMIGQPAIATAVAGCREINERTEVVRMPGLGNNLGDYLAHECARVGMTELPFDEGAVAELGKLGGSNFETSHDHPLVVNNIASKALDLAFRVKMQVVTAEIIIKATREERAA
jgi:type II secretory pathway predicted ATPase ExeA